MSKKRAARRAQIISGAISAIADHGYERATIQRIATQCDITPGLIHYHFKNKQEILVAVLDELSARLLARYEASLPTQDDTATVANQSSSRIDAFISALLSRELGEDQHALACWVAIAAESVHSSEVQVHFDGVMLQQHALLCEALEQEHRCQPALAQEIATAILAQIQGVFLLSQASPELMREGFALRQVRASIRGMLILAMGV